MLKIAMSNIVDWTIERNRECSMIFVNLNIITLYSRTVVLEDMDTAKAKINKFVIVSAAFS